EALEVGRIVLNLGYEILDRDTARHVPIRVENDVPDGVAEYGRPLVAPPHHDPHRQDDFLILDNLELIGRDVHQDAAPPQVLWQPTPTLEVQPQLLDAIVRADVQLSARRRVYHSVRIETV